MELFNFNSGSKIAEETICTKHEPDTSGLMYLSSTHSGLHDYFIHFYFDIATLKHQILRKDNFYPSFNQKQEFDAVANCIST